MSVPCASSAVEQIPTAAVEPIAELITQDYPLDPGAVEYLVEQALGEGTDVPVRLACSLLRLPLSPIQRENLASFLARASENAGVRRALLRATTRMGRCPKNERRWLQARTIPIEPPPTPLRAPPGVPSSILDLSGISGSLGQLPTFIDRLCRFQLPKTPFKIRLADFTYAAALAVLAEWILSNRLVPLYEFDGLAEEMERYLERIDFPAALRNREIKISPDPMDWAVGLTRINRDQPTEKVTEKIVDIIHTFANVSEPNRQALLILISEMIENVHRHAMIEEDGFAVAQVYPKQYKMGITLVDAGIGVRRSFELGDPSVPIGHLRSDGEFLREAVKLHVTSKRTRHSGYGLYLLAELVARNRGTFLLTSGGATLVGYYKQSRGRGRAGGSVEFENYLHAPWQGTIISVILDLQHDLPLLEIYSAMPAPAGYEDDDFFVN